MTFSRVASALVLCGCTHAPTSVTVQTALARAQEAVVTPEPEEDYGCGVFAKNGVSENASDFRSCLEQRVAAEEPCGEGSPSLVTLELAVALIDGAGGSADVPRARKLVGACFRDGAVETVLAHADDVDKSPRARALETCDDIAQTTLASTDCITEHVLNERAWLHRERRSFGGSLRPVFDAASRAASAWATKLGEVDYARYADGTMRGPAMQSRILAAMKTRRDRLERIHAPTPSAVTDYVRDTAIEDVARARSAILENAEPEVAAAIEAEEKSWLTYRDAEADLYDALHSGSRAAAMALLAAEHARTLCAMSSEP